MKPLNVISKPNRISKEFLSLVFIWIILFFFFLWFFGISGIISLSWFYSYAEIVAWKTDKTPYFQTALSQFDLPLLYQNYLLARIISVLLLLLGTTSIVLLILKRKVFSTWLYQAFRFLIEQWTYSKQAFLALRREKKLSLMALFVVSIAIRLYHFSYLPMHVDELMTYYFFVKEGFLLTSLYYPIPNNHVFFNYIFILSSQLIEDPILAARIPSALAFHLMLLLLFSGLLRYFKSFSVAFLSTTICVLLFPSSVYAAEGRGYAVLSLMVILAAFSLLLIIEKNRKEALAVFIPACVVGAWTVPVFLIPFLSFMSFWLWESVIRKSQLLFKWMIITTFLVGIGVLISYLPILLFSGLGAIASNETVAPVQATNFFTYIYPVASAEILSFFAGTNTKGWIIFLMFGLMGLGIYLKADEQYRRWMALSFFVLIMIFLYALVGRRFMFQRTITYATYFLYPAAAIIFVYGIRYVFKEKFVRRALLGLIIICIPIIHYIQYQKNVFEVHLLPGEYYNTLDRHFNQAIEERDKVYLHVSYMYVILYGKYLAEKKNMRLVSSIEEANVLVIEESIVNELGDDVLSSFQQTDKAPALASFLDTLLFYKRE